MKSKKTNIAIFTKKELSRESLTVHDFNTYSKSGVIKTMSLEKSNIQINGEHCSLGNPRNVVSTVYPYGKINQWHLSSYIVHKNVLKVNRRPTYKTKSYNIPGGKK